MNVKSEGDAVGTVQSSDALRCWMVAGPQIMRITMEFKTFIESKRKKLQETHHHEQTKSTQATFAQQIRILTEVIEQMENPFLEESTDLLRRCKGYC